jgi:hypothetical protein
LALGVLLVVALGLLIRVLAHLKLWQRLSLGAILLGGLLFTGDRSSLIAAFIILVFGKRFSAARAFALLAGAAAAVLLLIDVGALKGAIVTDFASSGSFGHRAAAYGLIWKLFSTQPAAAAFGGDGFGSTQRLFDHGQLQTDGFNVVDNQFVLIQSQGGVICLFLFLALAILAIVCARRSLRPVIIFAVAVSAIFDWLSWPSASALVFLLLGAGVAYVKAAAAAPAPAWPPNFDLSLDNRQPALH